MSKTDLANPNTTKAWLNYYKDNLKIGYSFLIVINKKKNMNKNKKISIMVLFSCKEVCVPALQSHNLHVEKSH